MNLLEILKAKRKALETEEDGIIAAAEKAGELSDDQRERLAAMKGEYKQLDEDIATIADRQARARTEPAALVDDQPVAGNGSTASFPTPFASFGEQLVAVARSSRDGVQPDQRVVALQNWAAAQGLNETVPSEGGYLVQPDYGTELLREAIDTGTIVSRTRERPVSGSGFRANAVDETSRADGSRFGGLQAYWTGEAETMTASKPKFRKIRLDLEKLTGVYYATDELLQDGPALQAEVEDWFTEEFGFKLDDAVLRGTGAGMPLGIFNSDALVAQAKESGQTADTVVAANVQNMYARMPARLLGDAIWVINQEVWPQLFALEDTEGHRIFLPANGLAGAPFGTLLGRPIIPSEQASALGDLGDINFFNLSRYLTIRKAGVQADSSIHVQFLTGETAFRFIVRANGEPIPSAPVTPYKGSATQSPFVSLAARA